MKHITQKVDDGVLLLKHVPTTQLQSWLEDCNRQDRDTIGHELMYRK